MRALLLTALVATGSTAIFGEPIEVYDDGVGAYWHVSEHDAGEASPGASGATLEVVNTANLVYTLNATNEYIYWHSCVKNDYDEASNISIRLLISCGSGVDANDTIDLELIAEWGTEHELTNAHTQTITVSHDVTTDNAQHELHFIEMQIDYDDVTHPMNKGQCVHYRLRLDDVGAGKAPEIHFQKSVVRYRTNSPANIVGTFPTEG